MMISPEIIEKEALPFALECAEQEPGAMTILVLLADLYLNRRSPWWKLNDSTKDFLEKFSPLLISSIESCLKNIRTIGQSSEDFDPTEHD